MTRSGGVKDMRRMTKMCVAVHVSGLAADAAAQGQGQARDQNRNQSQIRFHVMDTNNDGRIQRTEWRGNARSFTVHDWNGDGVLAGNEVQIGARRPRNAQPADLDSPWDEPANEDWTVDHFRSLDRDANGTLTAVEWIYARETFRRIDHNNDNRVSQAEFMGSAEVDDDHEDLFEYLDDNS